MKTYDDCASLARNIRLVILDVDGVLTDGGLYYNRKGHVSKRFNAQDGLGIKLLQNFGVRFAVVTGLGGGAVKKRIRELGIADYFSGRQSKLVTVESVLRKYTLSWSAAAYVGDDWVDIPPMLKVGLPIAVANAQPEVKEIALWTTEKAGGEGAVREVCRRLMEFKGIKAAALEKVLAASGIPKAGEDNVT